MSFELTASMMCANYGNLEKEVRELDEGGIDSFHIDIMDGRYVPNFAMSLNDMRYIAKTMMNGFYGKTALRTTRQNVLPIFNEESNTVCYSNRVNSEIEPVYIPYGTFVTAWARHKLIDSAMKVWDDFVYCDTDSIHCFEKSSYPFPTHPTELGYLKDETANGAYEYARYIKQKTYCHARPDPLRGFMSSVMTDYGDYKPFKEVVEIRAAGLNTDSRSGIKIEEFKYGLEIKNANFKMRTVPGGAVLYPSDWKLEKLDVNVFEDYIKSLEKTYEQKDFKNGEWTVA